MYLPEQDGVETQSGSEMRAILQRGLKPLIIAVGGVFMANLITHAVLGIGFSSSIALYGLIMFLFGNLYNIAWMWYMQASFKDKP